jgi:hypothetical protein
MRTARTIGANSSTNVTRPRVTVVEDVESGIRNEPGHDPRVETRDDWIVPARQDEGRLTQPVQPVDTRPADTGQKLPVVPLSVARPHLARQSRRERVLLVHKNVMG